LRFFNANANPANAAIPVSAPVVGSGTIIAATTAVPIGVPVRFGIPKTEARPAPSAVSIVKTLPAPISKNVKLDVVLPPAVKSPVNLLVRRLIVKLEMDADEPPLVKVRPPECVIVEVVLPPVMGKTAFGPARFKVAGAIGVMPNPRPTSAVIVAGTKFTVVVPPAMGVALALGANAQKPPIARRAAEKDFNKIIGYILSLH
jgi:hypothetical protein